MYLNNKKITDQPIGTIKAQIKGKLYYGGGGFKSNQIEATDLDFDPKECITINPSQALSQLAGNDIDDDLAGHS